MLATCRALPKTAYNLPFANRHPHTLAHLGMSSMYRVVTAADRAMRTSQRSPKSLVPSAACTFITSAVTSTAMPEHAPAGACTGWGSGGFVGAAYKRNGPGQAFPTFPLKFSPEPPSMSPLSMSLRLPLLPLPPPPLPPLQLPLPPPLPLPLPPPLAPETRSSQPLSKLQLRAGTTVTTMRKGKTQHTRHCMLCRL